MSKELISALYKNAKYNAQESKTGKDSERFAHQLLSAVFLTLATTIENEMLQLPEFVKADDLTVTPTATILNVSVTARTTDSATINWDVSPASGGQVFWGTSATDLTNSGPLETTELPSHSYTLSGLPENTTIYYRIDSGGTLSAVNSFITLATMTLDAGAIFVSTTGNDANDGSEANPKASIETAANLLAVGQTLYLRGGVYKEPEIEIDNTAGTSTDPIQIKAYPGETPVADSSLDVTWSVLDAANDIYIIDSDVTKDHLSGYWWDGTTRQSFVYYENQADFESNIFHVSASSRYVGPGLWHDGDKIRMRTTPVPAHVLPAGVAFSTVFDPRITETKITNKDTAITVDTSHVKFDGVDVVGAIYGYQMKSGNENLTVLSSDSYCATQFLLRSNTLDVHLESANQLMTFSEWLAWTDIKGTDGQSLPASHSSQRVTGFSAEGTTNLTIKNLYLERALDGGILTNSHNVLIDGTTGTTLDDHVQTKTSCSDVVFINDDMVGPGPSHHGDGTPTKPGTKYILNSKYQGHKFLWGKSDPDGILRSEYSGLKGTIAFSSHSTSNIGDGDPWKIYNLYTSAYTEDRDGFGYELWKRINATSADHEVFNCIFEVLDNGYHDVEIDVNNTKQNYNFNTYIGGKFRKDAGGVDYDTLDEWKAANVNGWDQDSTDVLNASDPVKALDSSWPYAAEINAFSQRGPMF